MPSKDIDPIHQQEIKNHQPMDSSSSPRTSNDSAVSETDQRMLTYLQQEQDFFQYVNQHRRDRVAPPTPTDKFGKPLPGGEASQKGLQCLLALTHLLEETVKVRLCHRTSAGKDHEDLCELRKQAERMGLTDRHHDSHHMELNYSDEQMEDYKINGHMRSHQLDVVDFHESNKTKSLRVGTQMLSGTIGRVRTKFLRSSQPVNGGSFVQRKHKGSGNAALRLSVVTSNPPEHVTFCQRQLSTPPTPLDSGDVWLGGDDLMSSCPPGLLRFSADDMTDKCRLAPDGTDDDAALAGEEFLFEKVPLNRHASALATNNNTDDYSVERFASLPDNLEHMEFRHRAGSTPNKPVSGNSNSSVMYKTSYEAAVSATMSPPPSVTLSSADSDCATSYLQFDPQSDSSNKKEDPMESIKSKLGKDFLMSKDFAKKMESWNAKKDCGGKDHKDNHTRPASNDHQPRKAGKKSRAQRPKNFNRQRSMSADRAGLLSGSSNAEFEEKLRQWGIKQAHDPHYYLNNNKKSSEGSVRSVESPGRMSRRDEVNQLSPPSLHDRDSNSANSSQNSTIKSPVFNPEHKPISIERGRRVSPTRHKRYSRESRSSHGSHRSSNEAMSSSSGSIEPLNQLSPNREMLNVNQPSTARSISAESLVSIGDEIVDLDRNSSNVRAELMRPLSMIGMPGSLEGEYPASPNPVTPGDERKLLHSTSRELLRTINEDINKIRERKALMSDSSSDRSLDRCLAESTPERCRDRHTSPPAGNPVAAEANVGAADLPSLSICVDSGLVMEEDEFCDPSLQPINNVDQMVIIENSPDPSLMDEPTTMFQAAIPRLSNQTEIIPPKADTPKPEVARKWSQDERRLKFSRSRTENVSGAAVEPVNNEPENDPLLEAIQAQQQKEIQASIKDNTSPTDALSIAGQTSHSKVISSAPKQEQPVINVNISSSSNTIISVSSSESETTPVKKRKSTKKPPKALPVKEDKIVSKKKLSSSTPDSDSSSLEPLLSSKTVPLKTKLQHLSSLYDCEDDVNIKVKQEEPSGPYDIFKAPAKLGHQRSKSEDTRANVGALEFGGSLEDIPLIQSPTGRQPQLKARSNSEHFNELETGLGYRQASLSSVDTGITTQTSPVIMRKNVRSPVPVQHLVSKFNQPTSQEVSMDPSNQSASLTSHNASNMAKIAERLMQNQSSKSYRCTVDLSRHVREIPKEGAVQRARSIFMDMTSSH